MIKNWLISYPKSGRTWLRVIIDQLNVKYNRSHFFDAKKDSNVVYLYRNPLETFVSYYFQLKYRHGMNGEKFSGSIKDFVDTKYLLEIIKHHEKFIENKNEYNNILCISYKDLHTNGPQTIFNVVNHFGKNASIDACVDAYNNINMEIMRNPTSNMKNIKYALLPTNDADIEIKDAYKARDGKMNNYDKYLDTEDIAKLKSILDKNNYQQTEHLLTNI